MRGFSRAMGRIYGLSPGERGHSSYSERLRETKDKSLLPALIPQRFQLCVKQPSVLVWLLQVLYRDGVMRHFVGRSTECEEPARTTRCLSAADQSSRISTFSAMGTQVDIKLQMLQVPKMGILCPFWSSTFEIEIPCNNFGRSPPRRRQHDIYAHICGYTDTATHTAHGISRSDAYSVSSCPNT